MTGPQRFARWILDRETLLVLLEPVTLGFLFAAGAVLVVLPVWLVVR